MRVQPFLEQPDGDDVIIADPDRACYLSVPREAVTLLRLFAEGFTVGEASAAYQRQYGMTPDVDDFLEALTDAGFLDVQARGGDVSTATPTPTPVARAVRRYHFGHFPESLARRLCSAPVLLVLGAVVGLALAACFLDPSVVPPPTALVFERDQVGLTVLLIVISLTTLFAHEMAHLVAARAAGIPARMGLGNRLWILVAETDMTGIWLASRRQRCVAFLAGPLFDLANVAVLVLVVFAAHRSWLDVDPTLMLLLQAWLFVGLTRLLWQVYFFMPTDFYYVIGAMSGCKSLMHDTQVYLLNRLARVVRWIKPVDQSNVPTTELRVVRWFALVWLGGRALAFASLFVITLPVLAGYGVMLGGGLSGDPQAVRPLFEGPLLPLMGVALQTIGIVVWIRSSFRPRRSSR